MKHLIYCLLIVFSAQIAVHSQVTLQNDPMIFEGCGVDYIVRSQKITNRDSNVIFKDLFTKGTEFPIELVIDQLPTECYKIEKAYIWMTYSNGLVNGENPEPRNYDFSIQSPGGEIDILSTKIVKDDEGTGWLNDNKKFNYRLDVTDIIKHNGKYILNTDAAKDKFFKFFIDGLAMVIVYRRYDSDFQGHLILNEGLITSFFDVNKVPKILSNEYDIKGLNVCETTTDTRSFILVSDLQGNISNGDRQECYVWFDFNGNTPQKALKKFWNYETDSNFQLTEGQTNYRFKVSAVPDVPINDRFSVPIMGVYYRTKQCDMLCESTFPTTLHSSSDEICPGGEVTLTANITEDYANEQIQYHWTSTPAGLDQFGKSITVTPLVSTTYYLHAILGNGCLVSNNKITINVATPPRADAGNDISICGNMVVQLGNPPTHGVPPYRYEWSPAAGLSATDILHPSVQNISTETKFILKVTDANNCIGYDTVIVTPYNVSPPEIQVIGDTHICHCDSVKITAVGDFNKYLWSNGATTKSIYASQPGSYSVTVTDNNDCSNSSAPITITTFEPNTTVSLNDTLIYAKPGEIIEIPLKIKSIEKFEECKLKNYTAQISFDRSVLVPVNGTPFGIINEPIRTITIEGMRKDLETILYTLKLEAVLGNSDYVKVNLDNFSWLECDGEVKLIDNAVKIVGLCYEGGTRLFNSNKANSNPPKVKANSGTNSVTITFGILERCQAQLYFSDMLGRVIKTFSYRDIESGSYELELNVSDFPPGVYICTLRVGDELYNQMMRITN